MKRPIDRHLDDAEIDALVSLPQESDGSRESVAEHDVRELRSHIDACEECTRKVQMHQDAQAVIANLKVSGSEHASSECPGDSEWLQVAAGLLPTVMAKELMVHASQCDHCGPILRNAAATLSDAATPEEEAQLASLPSARPGWRRTLATELGKGPGINPPAHRYHKLWNQGTAWPRWAVVGVACTLAIASGWFITSRLRSRSVDELLAEAYSQRRNLELRIGGAKYGPMRTERLGGRSTLERPASLLRAELLIKEQLSRNPDEPTLLRAEGEVDLLEGNYDSAIRILKRALQIEPDSSHLLTDLATAHFQRGIASDSPTDYGVAVEYLGKTLAKSPDDPIALFNRAIVSERMFLYSQAIQDWEHYLRIDPQGEWSEEARGRLTRLRQKVKDHQQSSNEPLLTPAELSGPDKDETAIRERIDTRFEEYLRVAVQDWLPSGFSAADPKTREQSRFALGLVAELASARHSDTWLHDLLADDDSTSFSAAVVALSQAVTASDTGNYELARRRAAVAQQLFTASGNRAGVLRAEFENVFQLDLEHAVCLSMLGNFTSTQQLAARAIGLAESAGYPTLHLRAIGLASDTELAFGDSSAGWKRAYDGLAKFWAGNYAPMQGYNLYTNLDTAADMLQQRHLQVAIWQQAIDLIDSESDVLLRAMAHSWMAQAYYTAGLPRAAEREYGQASRLFAAAPQTEATLNDRIQAEVWLARLLSKRGESKDALARLTRLKPYLSAMSNNYVAINFYSSLGEVQLDNHLLEDSDVSVRTAVGLAEQSLKSLRSERARATWNRDAQTAYRALVELKVLQGDARTSLELWEWYRGAPLRQGRHRLADTETSPRAVLVPGSVQAPRLPDLQVVKNSLPRLNDRTTISYAVLPHGLAIWVYDDAGVALQWRPGVSGQVALLAARFTELCSDPASDIGTVRRDGKSLYDLIVGPIQGRLFSHRALVIETDGDLAGIPFEALLEASDQYLDEGSSVVMSMGLYYDMRLISGHDFSSQQPVLVVGVPSVSGDQPSDALPDALHEAEALAASFPHAYFLKGNEATIENIEKYLPGAAIFHFAGHAVAVEGQPRLLLADSGNDPQKRRMLDAEALDAVRLRDTELVVLSACATAQGQGAGFAEPNSLARVFISKGVPHVVASHWPVDSATTEIFMQEFYRGLLSGIMVSEATKRAALVIRSRPETAHPYYWSAFSAFGLK